MRKSIVGVAVAAVTGASLVILPSALAASPSASVTPAKAAAAKPAARSKPAIKTAVVGPAAANKCAYPSRHRRHVSLEPEDTTFHGKHVIVFHGSVRGNKCKQKHVKIDLFNKTQGRIVISGYTDNEGNYSLIIKPQGTFTYVSRAKPDKRYYTAYSNTAHVTVKPRRP